MLGSLDPESPLPVPLSAQASRGTSVPSSPSLAQVSASPLAPPTPTQWAWDPGLGPRLSCSVAQSVDDFLVEKWRKYFPSKPPSGPCTDLGSAFLLCPPLSPCFGMAP